MSRNRLERGQKPKKRGSDKKAKFEDAVSSSMRDGVRTMKDFMDSPGMQGPTEREREEQIRKMMMKQYERMSRDEMLNLEKMRRNQFR